MDDGGRVYGDQPVLTADLCELSTLLCPGVKQAGAESQKFSGGGGGGGRGQRGPQGAAGVSGVDGPQGPQGPTGSGEGGGWTDDGAVVRLTTATDQVVIGAAVPFGTEKVLVVGDFRVSSGQILNANGTAALPSYSFAVDPDTGMFRVAADVIGVSTGGTTRLTVSSAGLDVTGDITSTGAVRTAAGSAAAPSHSFTAATDTGMFLSGGALAFSSTGTHVFTATSATTPRILAEGSGTAALPFYSRSTDPDTGMFFVAANTLGFSAGGVTSLTITPTGGTLTGKFTVTGSFDPTDITMSGGGTAHWMQWGAGSTAPVSAAGTGRIRYNEVANQFEQSLSGAAYVAFGGGTSFPLQGPADSAAIPNYSWSADTDTGMFNPAANVVGFSAGGTETFRVTTTGATVTGTLLVTSEIGLNERVGDPAPVANRGFVYTKDLAGVTELFFEKDNGTVVQLSGGAVVTFPLQGPPDSAAIPNYSWAADTDTGMYNPGANIIGFSTLGVERGRVTTAGFQTIAGSAAAPSYSFTGDPNTGIFNFTTDTVDVSTAGITRFRVSTTAVSAFLPLSGNTTVSAGTAFLSAAGSAAVPSYSFTADSDTGFFNFTTNTVDVTAGAATRLRISDVDIRAFVVALGVAGSAGAPTWSFTGDSNSGIFSAGADIVGISAGGTETFRVDTTGPTALLDRGYRATSQVSSAGANTGTLLNAPAIGDPAFWLRVVINGVNHAIPAWLG